MSLENLIGNLMTYEIQLEDRKKDDQQPFSKKKELAFHTFSDMDNSDDDEEDGNAFKKIQKVLDVR